MEETIINLLVGFVQGYPALSVLVMAFGVFRAIFKPIMTVLETYVSATPTQTDNLLLAKILESKAYKALVWLIDYSMSIKLPK